MPLPAIASHGRWRWWGIQKLCLTTPTQRKVKLAGSWRERFSVAGCVCLKNQPANHRHRDEADTQSGSSGTSPRNSAIGRDELNLVDFPIGVLRYQQPIDSDGRRLEELVFSVDAFEENVGSIVPKKVTIRTSSRNGFPTPKEDELLIGLMLLCRLENNFTEPSVQFRISDLLRLLGWADNGRSRRQLRDGLDRLAGVKLKFENSWKSSEGREYEREFVTGILDSYDLNSSKDGETGKRELTKIQWSAEFYADIRRGNVRELDTTEYFALRLPLSRRLFRFLDKHLEADKPFEMNLKTFAAHLGISESRHIGKIRERLKRPIDELEQRGTLIQPQTDAERYHRLGSGNWLIRFERVGSNAIRRMPKSSPTDHTKSEPPKVPQQESEATNIVKAFYESWCDNPHHQPTKHERIQAEGFLTQYGQQTLRQLLPHVVKLMRERFPEATSFGATRNYWPLAQQKLNSRKQKEIANRNSAQAEQEAAARHEESRRQTQELRRQWNELEESQRETIRRVVLQSCDDFVRQKIESRQFSDPLVMVACLQQFRKNSGGGSDAN